MRGFELTRADAHLGIQPTPQLIALYGSAGRTGVYAVGLLDLCACVLIGGLAAGCSVQEMQNARTQRAPSSKQVEQASRFMRSMAALLKKRSPSDAPTLNAVRLSSQPQEKLTQLIEANSGRSDFLLRGGSMGVQGEAHLSFLLA